MDSRVLVPETRRVQAAVGEKVVDDLSQVSLLGPSGAVWGLDSPQLNANLVVIAPGEGIAEHVNGELDVLMFVTGGSGTVVIDGVTHEIRTDSVLLIPRGATRSVRSDDRLAYLTVHHRRVSDHVGPRRS